MEWKWSWVLWLMPSLFLPVSPLQCERVLPGKQAAQTPACSPDCGRGAEQPAHSLRFSCNLACLVRFVFSNYFLVCFDRRLEPTEKPLQIVYDYLAGLGFDDPVRMQEEAANSDLSCMIRFYSGKKLCVCTRCSCSLSCEVELIWCPSHWPVGFTDGYIKHPQCQSAFLKIKGFQD